MHNHDEHAEGKPMSQRWKLALVGFLLIATYFLWTEHRAHLAGALVYLPWLFLLACPLLHIFMHGNHGGHDRSSGDRR